MAPKRASSTSSAAKEQCETPDTEVITKGNLRQTISEVLDDVLTTKLSAKISELMDIKFAEFEKKLMTQIDIKIDDKVQPIEGRLHTVELNCTEIEKKNKDCATELADLRNEVARVTKELHETHSNLNNLEQHGRRWAVRIHGLKVSEKPWEENGKKIASDFFKEHLKLDIPLKEIDCAHRVGMKTDGKQPMLVKFLRRDNVDKIILVRKQLKGLGFVIYEDATTANKKLLNRLKNHSEIQDAWLVYGKVWAKSKAGKKFTVNIMDNIDKLMQK